MCAAPVAAAARPAAGRGAARQARPPPRAFAPARKGSPTDRAAPQRPPPKRRRESVAGPSCQKPCDVPFLTDRAIEIDPVTGRAAGLKGAQVNPERYLAASGQRDTEIGFEFSFDDLPFEDHQGSAGGVVRWRLAGGHGPLECLLRRLRLRALVPLPVSLALGLELLEPVADPIDQAPL